MNTFKDHHHLICRHLLDGTILSANATAATSLGVPPAALVGRKIHDFLSDEGRAGFGSYIDRIMCDGVAEGTMVVRGAGDTLRTWEYRNTLHRRDGVPIVHGRACDVTDREDMFRALRESEEHFRSIIDNVSDVITIIEPAGVVRYASPSVQPVLGYAPAELQGKPIFDVIHAGDRQRAEEFLARLDSPAEAIELRFTHANGSPRFVEVVARNVMHKEHVTSIIATARDITERRKLQMQLQTANRLASLGRLAATVAHEFNNVLMSMQPFTELLQRPKVSPETVFKAATRIGHSIARGKQITQDILRFTQPAEPALVPVKIDDWWSALYPEVAAVMTDNIEIVTDFADPSLHVLADASQLAQVFVNLLTNARDAMPAGGRVTIGARRSNERIQFDVTDTGCGMPADMLQQIFEPLFTSKPKGTGLGLAVAHHVVERHNGEICVESTPGHGTTFHLDLPAADPAADQKVAAQTRALIRSRRLLIVEDEPAIVDGLVELLRDAHLEVSTVASGEEAVAAVDAFEPDVVLLDFGLPGIDGLETCRRIRTRRPGMPVIFSSGHGTQTQLGITGDDSHTQYLQKPFEIAALLEAIAAVEAAL